MNWKHLIWIIPLVLFIGSMVGSIIMANGINYGAVVQFCHERGHDTPAQFERWNFNGTEVFTIKCVNDEGFYTLTETFPILNEVHTGIQNG